MMTPILLTPPAIEPLTLAEAKLWLRLDTADEDDSVIRLITAARLVAEAESGLKLITQAWRLVMDAPPSDNCLRVPLAPFQGVTAARVYDGAGAPAVVPPGAYSVDAASQPGRIILSPNFPPAGRAYAGIEFDILAGFGASAAQTPAPLRQAILLLIARWFENRGDAGMPGGAMPDDIRGLIQAFRRRRI